jgi:hypothetical protein
MKSAGLMPKDYYLQTIELPKVKLIEISTNLLPKNWRAFPHNQSTKSIGVEFISRNKGLILKVPSVVIQDEFNYLVNPFHIDYQQVKLLKIEEFKFDKRSFDR